MKDLVKECLGFLTTTAIRHPGSCHSFEDGDEVISLRSKLLKWYEENERPMPWRVSCPQALKNTQEQNYSPLRAYQVWISEVMLQQTQVAVVVKFYNEWMGRWPTLDSLASASQDEVLKVWSGLGYYSRAKRLLEGAQYVKEQCDGELPRTVEGLLKVPGIGPYTAGMVHLNTY